MLHIRHFGTGPQLVALHGFSQTGEIFRASARPLGRTVLAIDLPGHGESHSEPTDIDGVVNGVGAILAGLNEPVPLLGYSQGARVALLAALRDPSCITRLVLVGGTAGIRDAARRVERLKRDTELGERIDNIGVEAFIKEWTSIGITSLDRLTPEARAHDLGMRLANSGAGLRAALVGFGQGAQPSVWNQLDTLTVPVLLMVGEDDDTYRDINVQMSKQIERAEIVVVPGSGHNPLTDNPEFSFSTISDFLDRTG